MLLNAPQLEIITFCRWQLLTSKAQGNKKSLPIASCWYCSSSALPSKFCLADLLCNAIQEHYTSLACLSLSVLYWVFFGSVQALDAEATLIPWQVCSMPCSRQLWYLDSWNALTLRESSLTSSKGYFCPRNDGKFSWPKNSDHTFFLSFKLSISLGNSDLQ